MRILGVNAVFHDPAAAVVVDGQIVAAAEEERFSRRKHGKQAVPFSTWELPVAAARWCLEEAGLRPPDLDAVGYSYEPALMDGENGQTDGLDRDWEYLRTMYAQRACARCPRTRPSAAGCATRSSAAACPSPTGSHAATTTAARPTTTWCRWHGWAW